VLTFDHIIIGSGIAGLTFALKVAEQGSVAIVTKKSKVDSNTAWAQGGVACVTSDEDSIEAHVHDTMIAGDDLCDEKVVRTILTEGPERIAELMQLGMHFDERQDAAGHRQPDLGKEGGHSKRRILHAQDRTGLEIEKTLLAAVAQHPNITLLEHHMAIDLIMTGYRVQGAGCQEKNISDHEMISQVEISDNRQLTTDNCHREAMTRCVGLYVFDEEKNQIEALSAKAIVLATGGCGKVYLYTTNPDIATGDGIAMAWRAGATIANMEFMQFHPTCLFHPQAKSFLISEAVRGEGGVLLNGAGERFMKRYDGRLELAPRDVVARAIDAEMKRRGDDCVFLDVTHHSEKFLRERFPKIFETCLSYGMNIAHQSIPVVPAAHYQCGGIKTDLHGRTSIPGLYAIGETACTGLHGANRLASNSLLEALVMAHRAAQVAKKEVAQTSFVSTLAPWQSGEAQDPDELVMISHIWDEIRRLMSDYMGIVRTTKRLERVASRLKNLETEIQEFYWNFKISTDLLELRNLFTVASLMVQSALNRKESRGLHYTLDYPEHDPAFLQETLIARAIMEDGRQDFEDGR